jgi:hypothetical protein
MERPIHLQRGSEPLDEVELMLKKLQWIVTGVLIAFAAPWVYAQTPTFFANLRVGTTLQVPPAAPASPVDGELWITTSGLFARVNGSTTGPIGATNPGGANTQVQFNDSGVFGGDAGLTYNKIAQLTQTTNLTIQQSGKVFLSLNNSGATADQKKAVFWEGNGFAGICQLADAETDPSLVCDSGHPHRLPLSWFNTGTAITFTNLYGQGVDIQGASGDLTIDSGGTNIALSSNGELDLVAGTFISTGNSLLKTKASSNVTGAGLNLPHGAAPGTPVNGDLWTTTAGLFARINGVTVGPYSAGGTPGGANTQVQFNNSGSFGGDSGFVYSGSGAVTTTGLMTVGNSSGKGLQINGTSTGAANVAYAAFYESNGTTRKGYVGDSGSGNSHIELFSDAGNVRLTPVSGGSIEGSSDGGSTFVDMTPASGSFVVNFDNACTTTPTITFAYYKIGPVVTIQPTATSGFTCLSDSANFAATGADVPAIIRPSTKMVYSAPMVGLVLEGASTTPAIIIEIDTTGTMTMGRCQMPTSPNFTCLSNTWPGASTNLNFAITTFRPSFTYYQN